MKQYLPVSMLVIALISAWALDLQHYFTLVQLKTHQAFLQDYIDHHTPLAQVIFAVGYAIAVATGLPIATFLSIAAGFFFSILWGSVIVVCAATLGATALFLSVRLATAKTYQGRVGAALDKMRAGFAENSFSYLLTLRLIPLFPFFLVNIAAAVLKVRLRTFMGATFLGIIPASFIYVAVGAAFSVTIHERELSFENVLSPQILLALTGLGLLSLISPIYKHFQKVRKKQ